MSQTKFDEGLEGIKSAPGLIFAATYEPYPVSLLKVGSGRNSLGLSVEGGPLVLFLLYASWTNREDDDKVIEASKKVLEIIKKEAEDLGQLSPYTYMNYAFPGQDPISSYGSEVKEELVAVSKKYDPHGFFQKAVREGFKIL